MDCWVMERKPAEREREERAKSREKAAPSPITLHDGPITASALMVMCQHILPSGLTNNTALIQHPGLVVDTRQPAKMSNRIGNVWREAHNNDSEGGFYWSFLLLVHSPMLFTICLFIGLAFIHRGDHTPGILIMSYHYKLLFDCRQLCEYLFVFICSSLFSRPWPCFFFELSLAILIQANPLQSWQGQLHPKKAEWDGEKK